MRVQLKNSLVHNMQVKKLVQRNGMPHARLAQQLENAPMQAKQISTIEDIVDQEAQICW